jgi:hypothetical protein
MVVRRRAEPNLWNMAENLATRGKLMLGTMEVTKANRMRAEKWLRDELKQVKDLRDGDALKVMVRATTLIFLPSEEQIADAQYRGSIECKTLVDKGATWWHVDSSASFWRRLLASVGLGTVPKATGLQWREA